MITHSIPNGEAAPKNASGGQAPGCPAPVNQGRHGPFRVPLYVAARCQGAGVDPGAVPRGARARWLRGALLLPDARPAGARCRRQCAAQGNRDVDRALFALFGGARAAFGGALWHERGVEDRRRGEGDPHRAAENVTPASRTRSPLSAWATSFRSGSLGASARNSRRPPRRSARSRSSWAPGERRKVRMEHGNDDEQRQRTRCRWRTGSSYSRAHPPCGRVPRCALRRRLCRRHVRRRRLHP